MSTESIIDKGDKVWGLFLLYSTLIGSEAKNEGLDLYGVDQKTALASDLVNAHIMNDIVCALTDMNEQNAKFERSRYHLKPQATFNATEVPVEDKHA